MKFLLKVYNKVGINKSIHSNNRFCYWASQYDFCKLTIGSLCQYGVFIMLSNYQLCLCKGCRLVSNTTYWGYMPVISIYLRTHCLYLMYKKLNT